jgi:hypothetical protein
MDACPRRGRRPLVSLALLVVAVAVAGVASGPSMARGAEPSPVAADPWSHLDAAGEPVVDLWFGWSSTCPHCTKARAWLADFAPTAPWLQVHSLQVDGADADADIERLVALAAVIGEEIGGVPAFLFAGRLEVGFDAAATTGAQLEADLRGYQASLAAAIATQSPGASPDASSGPEAPADQAATAITLPFVGAVDAASLSLPLLAVVLGGLDAVNPCALAILLFLVSAMVGANDRRRIVLVGGTFIAATGVVYFLLMAAWLNAFLWLGDLRVITVLAGVAAVVAGLINVKDFGWFRRGPSLVIPDAAKPAIFGRIVDVSGSVTLPALLGTTVLVAATASAYEMLCTGGFPVVFTRVLTLAGLPTAAYYAYLGLYVLVYILPMLLIVGFFAVTLGSRGISIDEARRLKLLSGLLMVGIGGLLLVAPERLSDLTWTIGLFTTAILVWVVLVSLDRRRVARLAPSVAQPRK